MSSRAYDVRVVRPAANVATVKVAPPAREVSQVQGTRVVVIEHTGDLDGGFF